MGPISALFSGSMFYLIAGIVALGVGAYGGVKYQTGVDAARFEQIAQNEIKAQQAVIEKTKAQDAITARADLEAAEAKGRSEGITRTIIRKVPIYVSQKANSHCVVPYGFVRVFNGSVGNIDPSTIPNPSGKLDDDASPIDLSTVASVTAENNGSCNQTIDQLTRLQQWIRDQQNLDTKSQ